MKVRIYSAQQIWRTLKPRLDCTEKPQYVEARMRTAKKIRSTLSPHEQWIGNPAQVKALNTLNNNTGTY